MSWTCSNNFVTFNLCFWFFKIFDKVYVFACLLNETAQQLLFFCVCNGILHCVFILTLFPSPQFGIHLQTRLESLSLSLTSHLMHALFNLIAVRILASTFWCMSPLLSSLQHLTALEFLVLLNNIINVTHTLCSGTSQCDRWGSICDEDWFQPEMVCLWLVKKGDLSGKYQLFPRSAWTVRLKWSPNPWINKEFDLRVDLGDLSLDHGRLTVRSRICSLLKGQYEEV